MIYTLTEKDCRHLHHDFLLRARTIAILLLHLSHVRAQEQLGVQLRLFLVHVDVLVQLLEIVLHYT